VTTFNLRQLRLRSGEQFSDQVEIELEPLVLGGQEYASVPALVPADLVVTKAASGTVIELAFRVRLEGPCFRCLVDTAIELSLAAREYNADTANPGDDPDLRSPYVLDDVLDLSAWAHDTVALELPDKILHDPGCAGLCPTCGRDLNVEPHVHEEQKRDSRWAALEALRDPSASG
jgi:uncharacterized protein